jgi:XTP/dITP diphosphohydrolase
LLGAPTARIVVLTSSPRVAPGLLTVRAWDTLRSASRVLTDQPEHPQLAALTEAGVACEVIPPVPVPALAAHLAEAARAELAQAAELAGVAAIGQASIVWLARSGDDEPTTALLGALASSGEPGLEVEMLAGSHDLPGARLLDLVATMKTLRVNCPWDAKQTHESLAPYLTEESYEALDALESGDPAALCEELGDVLLQVMFHAEVASERTDGTGYTVDDIADGIVAKLVRRHPHVFGSVQVSGAEEVTQNWDTIKAAERAAKAARSGSQAPPASALDGVPLGQPALSLAAQLQRRAERAGAPASLADADPADPASALGEQLFRLVAEARAADLDPEQELRAAARRYHSRIQTWEQTHHPKP